MGAFKVRDKANRIREGFKLFLEGKVHADENLTPAKMRFFVEASPRKGSTQKKFYDVINRDGFWTCECDDWAWRHEQREGGFICKHEYAALFKLMELEFRNQNPDTDPMHSLVKLALETVLTDFLVHKNIGKSLEEIQSILLISDETKFKGVI